MDGMERKGKEEKRPKKSSSTHVTNDLYLVLPNVIL
jgi:hypothetical protein